MSIVNRDLHPSEQRQTLHNVGVNVATSVVQPIALLPYPCTLVGLEVAAYGVSNAMQCAFQLQRFVVGSGMTTINVGISNLVLVNAGTSGMQGFSGLAAPGSTLLQAQAGDLLQYTTSVANGNATLIAVNFVVRKTQDIVSHNGSIA